MTSKVYNMFENSGEPDQQHPMKRGWRRFSVREFTHRIIEGRIFANRKFTYRTIFCRIFPSRNFNPNEIYPRMYPRRKFIYRIFHIQDICLRNFPRRFDWRIPRRTLPHHHRWRFPRRNFPAHFIGKFPTREQ